MQDKHAVVYGLLSNLDEIEVSPCVDIVACTSRSCSCNHDFFSVVACPIKSNYESTESCVHCRFGEWAAHSMGSGVKVGCELPLLL